MAPLAVCPRPLFRVMEFVFGNCGSHCVSFQGKEEDEDVLVWGVGTTIQVWQVVQLLCFMLRKGSLAGGGGVCLPLCSCYCTAAVLLACWELVCSISGMHCACYCAAAVLCYYWFQGEGYHRKCSLWHTSVNLSDFTGLVCNKVAALTHHQTCQVTHILLESPKF